MPGSALAVLNLVAVMAGGGAGDWQAEGPTAISAGQVESIAGAPVAGAINVLAVHPVNPDILYAGTVNGGIWRTASATGVAPNWQPQTDALPSLSIGDLSFDPADSSYQTLVASIARSSSLNFTGGALSGVLRTTDSGANWQLLPALAGRNLIAVRAQGNRLVAASNLGDTGTCDDFGVFISNDTGGSWSRPDSGLPLGVVDSLVADPVDPDVLYASVLLAANCTPGAVNGIYKSLDFGSTWFKSSPPAATFPLDGLLEDSFNTHVEMATGRANNLFVAIAPASSGRLAGVYYTTDGGALWFPLDLPGSIEPEGFAGIHPGRQGFIHLSLSADPVNFNLVYIGGDRQPQPNAGFPNSLGANNFTGRLFRGDILQPPGGQWTPLTHIGTFAGSAPHADSRHLVFDAMGGLLDADDGGVYVRTLPQSFFGDWFSLNGNLQITEVHDAALDANAGVVLGGTQDTGSLEQQTAGNATWVSVNQGDGGDVAVALNSGQSVRFHSAAQLNSFTRSTYDADNNLLSQVAPGLMVIDGGADLVGQFTTPVVAHASEFGRVLIAGANSVYESTDLGDSLSEVLPGIVTNDFAGNAVVYGSATNPEFLAVAGCPGGCAGVVGQVFLRQSVGETPQSVFIGSAVGGFTAIAALPTTTGFVWLLQSDSVLQLALPGATTLDITGNLANLEPGRLRNLLAVNVGTEQVLLVAADRGVFGAYSSTGFQRWSQLGAGLPGALVFELDYDPVNDRLIAGTLGRGVFSLNNLRLQIPLLFADGFEP